MTETTGASSRSTNPRGTVVAIFVFVGLLSLSFWGLDAMGQDENESVIDGTATENTLMNYPATRVGSQRDEYFGTVVEDPYQWLEQDVRESDEVRQWVEEQNQVTFSYLEQLPWRAEIESRLTELWDFEKFGTPFRAGGRYYYQKNDGLQNQSVLYRLDTLESQPRVLLDPNQWSTDGTVALGGIAFSDDGKYLAYGVQESGSDWRTWRVMEIESGKTLDDELHWLKFGGVDWARDSAGFFYSRYDEPREGETFQSLNKNQKVFYHRVGTPQSDDVLIHVDPAHPDWGFSPEVTEDGRYLVITIWVGTDDRYRIKYLPLNERIEATPALVELINSFDHEFSFLGNEGSVFYFKSDVNAPMKCVLAIDVERPQRENWRVIIPEAAQTIESAGIVGDYLVIQYLMDAKSQVKLFDLNGNLVREVELPGIGTAGGFRGRRDHASTFYSFSSFDRPPTVYQYDLKTGESQLFKQAQVDFQSDEYEVKQVFYTSADGTRVPMFIAYKRGLKLNGRNPTLLYGYGGFNISLTPSFSISRLQWMEMGGVFAMANLRGGGEYGKAWHQAGTKTNKQNVFDDFIAAAEWLIDNQYTSAKHLAIQGGSNGGLLVGACMTQRPELFGACLPAVGVMDMLKFQTWTAGRFWVDDYGSSTSSQAEFLALYAYSPYHNLKQGTRYPATLVTTSDHDDRVVPGHSFKFAARLQASQAGANPTLIRIETKAGHGAGKPTAKIIEQIADQWAFLVKHLEMTDPHVPSKE